MGDVRRNSVHLLMVVFEATVLDAKVMSRSPRYSQSYQGYRWNEIDIGSWRPRLIEVVR